MMKITLLLSALTASTAFTVTTTTSHVAQQPPSTALLATRQDFLQTAFTCTAATAALFLPSAASAETLANGVTYQVKKAGTGPKPSVGELVAVRFAAYNGELKIDDIFETPEPYYTRCGSGGLLKGVESAIPLMQVGDRWVLTIPVSRLLLQ
jgi:FKBP-type peptidyl-prolyl cis-trans isomerase